MFAKGSTSSWKNESSTLELSNQYPQSSRQAEKSTFRSPHDQQPHSTINDEWSEFNSYYRGNSQFTPERLQHTVERGPIIEAPHPEDSRIIQEFLCSQDYTDCVYSISPPRSSISITPASAEHPNLYFANLLEAEDIESYLAQTTYSDDVYELPLYIQRLITEAKEEAVVNDSKPQDTEKARTALNRLRMVRDHLLTQNGGDVMQASTAANINRLTEDEMEGFWH
ncbi:hypothetical protein Unana1_02401 [Umbelopsis nana]